MNGEWRIGELLSPGPRRYASCSDAQDLLRNGSQKHATRERKFFDDRMKRSEFSELQFAQVLLLLLYPSILRGWRGDLCLHPRAVLFGSVDGSIHLLQEDGEGQLNRTSKSAHRA